jgi:hypothetical protein
LLQGSLQAKWAIQLLNASSAALDQDTQHNDKENSGYCTNNQYAIHVNSPFFFN